MKIVKGELQHLRFAVPYRIYGDAERVLVCVSGAQQTMAVWRSTTSLLSKKYSVVTFDSPGQGRSQVLWGSPAIAFEEQLSVLHRIVGEASGGSPVYMAAASWGTIVTAAYAALYPGSVDKLILGSFGVKPSAAMLALMDEGKQLYHAGRAAEVGRLMVERFGEQLPGASKRRIERQFEMMTEQQYESFYAHCEFVERAQHLGEFLDLSDIKAQTLIVNGSNDTILDLEDVAYASAHIPHCEIRVIPDAGHFLHFERPEILEIYDEFLSRPAGG